jgi:hypothetical protein
MLLIPNFATSRSAAQKQTKRLSFVAKNFETCSYTPNQPILISTSEKLHAANFWNFSIKKAAQLLYFVCHEAKLECTTLLQLKQTLTCLLPEKLSGL